MMKDYQIKIGLPTRWLKLKKQQDHKNLMGYFQHFTSVRFISPKERFLSKARASLTPTAKMRFSPNHSARQKSAKKNFKFCNKMKMPSRYFANQLFILLFLT
ncbi:hypothetical protein KGP17_04595 [Serratia sp. JSRIV001]|uniref:hypothetical protein n=1 Tax=Serratia sp. JSRIV001 TaxID=2831893 RepID=UPI001CBFFD97|nr:hypothetical protein [Serratia sp. JSRIV001]UAN46839.1 hypothetical protein KGP17_04595 [Serratia sp. JSRIV001]